MSALGSEAELVPAPPPPMCILNSHLQCGPNALPQGCKPWSPFVVPPRDRQMPTLGKKWDLHGGYRTYPVSETLMCQSTWEQKYSRGREPLTNAGQPDPPSWQQVPTSSLGSGVQPWPAGLSGFRSRERSSAQLRFKSIKCRKHLAEDYRGNETKDCILVVFCIARKHCAHKSLYLLLYR